MSDQVMPVPDKEYFTTGEIATRCAVTADTVRKWVQTGKLRADQTAGGHHRVHRNSFLAFLKNRQQRHDLGEKGKPFQFCWEFHAPSTGIYESCKQCIVYRSRAGRCYELAKLAPIAGHSMLFCTNTCEECAYYEIIHGSRPNLLIVTRRQKVRADMEMQARDLNCSIRFCEREYQCSSLIESFRPDYIVIDWLDASSNYQTLLKDLSDDPRIPLARIIAFGLPKSIPPESKDRVYSIKTEPISMSALSDLIGGPY